MDKMTSPEFEEKVRAAVSAPAPAANFVSGLRGKLLAQTVKKRPRVFLRPAWGVVLALVLALMTTVLVIGPRRVLAAVQKLFGYIPGIGIVESEQFHVLGAPVTVIRDGITLTVEQVVAEPEKTAVLYRLEGIPEGLEVPVTQPNVCKDNVSLRLPDGTSLDLVSGRGNGWSTGFENLAIFPPLPEDVDEVKFFFPCVQLIPLGTLPENWEVSLRLVPAPPDLVTYPVLELATPGAQTPVSPQPYGVSLTLDRAVKLDVGYRLYGTLHWDNTGFDYANIDIGSVGLLDVDGKMIHIEYQYPEEDLSSQHMSQLVYETAGIDTPGLVTFVVDSIFVGIPTDASFTFDAGNDPQPGQTWELDRTFQFGVHSLHILMATYVRSGNQNGFQFSLEADADTYAASLFDPNNSPGKDSGGTYIPGDNTFRYLLLYEEGFAPKGLIEIKIISIDCELWGPWRVTWSLPAP